MIFETPPKHKGASQDVLTYALAPRPDVDDNEPFLHDANDASHSLSRSQLRQYVKQVAAGLKALGVKKGDCVGCIARNDVYVPVLGFATIALGAVFCQLNFLYTEVELAHSLKTADISWVFAHSNFYQLMASAMTSAGMDATDLIQFDPHAERGVESASLRFSNLFGPGEQDWVPFDDLDKARNTEILRMFTSGSTGLPKAASINHACLVDIAMTSSPVPGPECKGYAQRTLQTIPLFHVTGWYMIVEAAATGNNMFYAGGNTAEHYAEIIAKHKLTDTMIPPNIIAQICRLLEDGKADLSSMRHVKTAGSPIQADLVVRLRKAMNNGVVVTSGYGSTEAGGIAAMPWPYQPDESPFPVGPTLPGNRIKLRNPDTGEEMDDFDTPGELTIQSASQFIGYHKNEDATRNSFVEDADGKWFKTGDICRISRETKFWTVLGRSKEVFKVRYEEVSPVEVEEILLTNIAIIDAAISPATGPSGDIEVKAYIHRKDPSLSERDVLDFLKDKVTEHKLPTAGIVFVDSIPRNPSGKILRGRLQLLSTIR